MGERAEKRRQLIERIREVAIGEGVSQADAEELAALALDIADPPPAQSTEADLTCMYDPPRAPAGAKRPLAPGELDRIIAEENAAHRRRLKENDKKYHQPDPDMDHIVIRD